MTGEVAGERSKAERQPASVTFLHQLNEVQDGLLLAGTADGAVRVWRNYAYKGEQRLATAWQVGTTTALCHAVLLSVRQGKVPRGVAVVLLSLVHRATIQLIMTAC